MHYDKPVSQGNDASSAPAAKSDFLSGERKAGDDMIHTWAGVTLIVAAMIHFVIHWRWVARVTGKMIGMASASRQTIAYR